MSVSPGTQEQYVNGLISQDESTTTTDVNNGKDIPVTDSLPNDITVKFSKINTNDLQATINYGDKEFHYNVKDKDNNNPINIEDGKIKSITTENLQYPVFSVPKTNGGKKSRRRRGRKAKGKSRKARSSKKSW